MRAKRFHGKARVVRSLLIARPLDEFERPHQVLGGSGGVGVRVNGHGSWFRNARRRALRRSMFTPALQTHVLRPHGP
jgi:hypothetical protein